MDNTNTPSLERKLFWEAEDTEELFWETEEEEERLYWEAEEKLFWEEWHKDTETYGQRLVCQCLHCTETEKRNPDLEMDLWKKKIVQ